MKDYQRIWNIKQADFFRDCGCELVKIETEYSEKLGKVGVVCYFLIDPTFRKAMREWRDRPYVDRI